MQEITNQPCQFCGEDKLALREVEEDIPHFGRVYILTAECSACGYKNTDVEPAEQKEPCKYTLRVENEKDLDVRIVKSGSATVKIPHIITMEPGPASNGYVTNVEGLLERVKSAIQTAGEAEDEPAAKKKAKNLLKKLTKVLLGREPLKIIIEDPTGFSAIISEKATKGKL